MSNSLNVIIVDDDQDDQDLMIYALARSGVPCITKSLFDGEELLGYLGQLIKENVVFLPDLIFLDINMPKLDGIETLKRVRALDAFNLIPVFLITTGKKNFVAQEDMIQLSNGIYSKPASLTEYDRMLQSIFSTICLPLANR
jgi:CheY-like chemotaxis protein